MSGKKKQTAGAARIIGRQAELAQLETLLRLGRNLLVEGPVGVGKTFLVREALKRLGREFERVDGDSRYTEQKLTGWFDPPIVLKKGYIAAAFVDGPLVTAMREGKVLFVNELNRMPEAVQNILLPAMDERRISLPKLGELGARPGFLVIATQNPREFTATHALSEALLDRFEMLRLDYQPREEERSILAAESSCKSEVLSRVLDVVRATRKHPAIRRGASIRAALAVLKLLEGGIDLESAVLMALPSRIEMVSMEDDAHELLRSLLDANYTFDEKKKDLGL